MCVAENLFFKSISVTKSSVKKMVEFQKLRQENCRAHFPHFFSVISKRNYGVILHFITCMAEKLSQLTYHCKEICSWYIIVKEISRTKCQKPGYYNSVGWTPLQILKYLQIKREIKLWKEGVHGLGIYVY